jgi:hypothetical protein
MVGEAFAAEEAFTAGVVLGPFTAGVSGTLTTIAVFMFPVSMATRGGGIGVIRTILSARGVGRCA